MWLLKIKKISCGPTGPDRPGRRPWGGASPAKSQLQKRSSKQNDDRSDRHNEPCLASGSGSGSIGVGVVGVVGRSGGRAVGRSGGRAVGRSDIGKIGYLFCIAKIANPVS